MRDDRKGDVSQIAFAAGLETDLHHLLIWDPRLSMI